jgi:hypothetical protein
MDHCPKKVTNMNSKIVFKEQQKFRQWWLWLILIFVAADTLWVTIREFKSNQGDTFEHIILPLILLVLSGSVIFFILSIKLETEIKEDGIYVRLFPIHRGFRFYPWNSIAQAYARTYKPLAEYGGWGLRGLGNNRALNIAGKEGLQLIMLDGRKLLIGTQKPQEITDVLLLIPEMTNKHHS